MNDYYNAGALISEQSFARSADINAILQSIAAGFDKLPDQLPLLQDRVAFITAGGTANALTATLDPAPVSYAEGLRLSIKASATNTGAATIDVNGLGARSIKRGDGTDIIGGDVVDGQVFTITYNGTAFTMQSTPSSVTSGIQDLTADLTFTGQNTFEDQTTLNKNLFMTTSGIDDALIYLRAVGSRATGMWGYHQGDTTYHNMLQANGSSLTLGDDQWDGQTADGLWVFDQAPQITGGHSVYHQNNILNAVSESSGTPTGGIVERGSNPNGEYVKFADGTMICTATVSSVDINNASGNVFDSGVQTQTFPVAFSARPVGGGSVSSTVNAWVNARCPGTTQWGFNAFAPTSQTGETIDLIAIGRWF